LKVKKYSTESLAELKLVIRRVENTPDKVMDSITGLFKPFYFPKQTTILKGEQKREHLFFIYKGLVRLYYKKEDVEVIESFESEGSFFGRDYTHSADQDIYHYAETLEDTWMMGAKLSDINELMANSHGVEHLAKLFLERKYVRLSRHLLEIKSMPAKNRYINFMENHSALAHRLPMKHIANYLGVKGETISRIRSNFQ
jgi:CRP-like cAMP-binding protein